MSENKSKFNIKFVNANIGDVYYRFAELFLFFSPSNPSASAVQYPPAITIPPPYKCYGCIGQY